MKRSKVNWNTCKVLYFFSLNGKQFVRNLQDNRVGILNGKKTKWYSNTMKAIEKVGK